MFEGQHPDEEEVFVLSRQPVVLFWPAFFITLSLFLPLAAFIIWHFSSLFYFVLGLWFLGVSFYLFRSWFCYKRSQYILTTKRLIIIEQKGIFYQIISEAPLEKIQDVSLEIKGIWPLLWDYGTIYLQTAGIAEKFVLKYVEEPHKIKDQIVETVHDIKAPRMKKISEV